jgi:hypothetical protein
MGRIFSWLLLPIVEKFGMIALKIGIVALEKKYPGVKPILDLIIGWLKTEAVNGNQDAVRTLQNHVEQLCIGPTCQPISNESA